MLVRTQHEILIYTEIKKNKNNDNHSTNFGQGDIGEEDSIQIESGCIFS